MFGPNGIPSTYKGGELGDNSWIHEKCTYQSIFKNNYNTKTADIDFL